MAKATKSKTKLAQENGKGRLVPPAGGATVRMYRIGHGDCFLIAFAGDDPERPVYVLIDCGYKPGSPGFIDHADGVTTTADEIVDNIRDATGGRVDVAVITHEHQDHVNGISESRFQGLEIGEAWFAWTENPSDDLANDLRKKFKDKLVGLLAARNRMAASGKHGARVTMVDELLSFELGVDGDEIFDAATAGWMLNATGAQAISYNKRSMKVFKDKAEDGIKFLRPHSTVYKLPRSEWVRVFPLGPPRDSDLLASLNPTDDEGFHSAGLAVSSSSAYFSAAALCLENGTVPEVPFARRYAVEWKQAFTAGDHCVFFNEHYGDLPTPLPDVERYEAPSDADWRRINEDWLFASTSQALDMNNQTNNSSLVLAFELGKGGKVLLFAADAQRGSWISWSRNDFADGQEKVSVRELLSRTVLYKVGHHGSHNATLKGQVTDDYTNLSWLGQGEYAREFCAMITAVRKWADTQKGWDHPLKAIKDALMLKAGGRVLQTDTAIEDLSRASGCAVVDWKAFQKRTTGTRLYFDHRVER